MNHWIHRLDLLSLEELESLRSDPQVGACKPIELEYSVKLLMAKLPTLRRDIALVLINTQEDPSAGKTVCHFSTELSGVFIYNKATKRLLQEAASMCSEVGLKVYRRAEAKYENNPQYRSIELSTDELFAHLDKKKAEEGEDTHEAVEEFAKDLPADERDWLKAHLRETYGLESAEDWKHLKEARVCVRKQHPELMREIGRTAARRLSKIAFDLYTIAKANNCSPMQWAEWLETKAMVRDGKVNPASIINVPGTGQIWGDGEPVRKDSNGNPRRREVDIFGAEVASNEVADVSSIDRMVRKAWG